MTDNTSHRVAADELCQFVERVERLESEKAGVAELIKEAMSEAKARGYLSAILRKAIARRKMTPDDVAEGDAMLDLYESTLNGSR